MSSGVTAIAAGFHYSLAVRNGGLYAWGDNLSGYLGDGTKTNRTTPVAVSGMSGGVTVISAGPSHSLAVQNGGLFAWGDNISGNLGDGSTNQQSAPVAVNGMASGVTAIAAGYYFSLAVQNGGVYAWGSNIYGALGDGTTTDRHIPVHIDPADLNSIVAVAAAQRSSYALSSDGSLWVWGYNVEGELGLGNTTTYLPPQHLLPPAGYRYSSIEADGYGYHALATLAAVPEPTSGLLLAFGGLTGAAMLRRHGYSKSLACGAR